MIKAVVFDLDGVVRHFDSRIVASIEADHGLAQGLIHRTAFSDALLRSVTTGKISRNKWVEVVGEHIHSPSAATTWAKQNPQVDQELMGLVARLSSRGYRTVILTNGTDSIPAEMRGIDPSGYFDEVFNSADIGHAKPDPRVYTHVLEALALQGHEVFFTDDQASNVAAAERLSIVVHHFRGVALLKHALVAAGVDVG